MRHEGTIERAHDYLERSFVPGRSFTGPADFNTQLQQWLQIVNTRRRRALGCAPADRLTADSESGPVRGRSVRYRLVASAFTSGLAQARRMTRRLEAGIVRVNAPTSGWTSTRR